MNPPSNYKEEIRERFEIRFAASHEHFPERMDLIADFFLAELDRVVGEEREAIRKRVGGMKKDEEDTHSLMSLEGNIKLQARNKSYNTALSDVLSLLAPSSDKVTKQS